jgi:hypothetical protein
VFGEIGAEQLGQQVAADRQRCGQTHVHRRQAVAALAHAHLDLARTVQQIGGLGQQGAPALVEDQPPAGAVEQRSVERRLQLGQRLAGGRLGQGNGVAGRADAAVAAHRHEDLELAQGESHHTPSYS